MNVLLPSKWNKDSKDGAWHMDVDIVEHDEQDNAEDETEEVAFI